ncbi:TIGR02652 family protein [Mastigocoleus sp. MO_188.B34]|uniref:TIGR02652 family protein n=1 Tax=Mastigocoleus sp. MO_188.B34 TaxID=3036635 RepID=UPI002634DD43|nr:TIGR02652 family protein [Mastigocoleus sp. MO_188.B34]MDJ0695360.1 TIGR02652 family protein [Mastigocoleus sp. MO_188.B34]
MKPGLQYPIFGPEIKCPHCHQAIPALTLTDTYLCPRHGAFEANPETKELIHLQSGRHWRRWNSKWFRQHTHPDGIRFEIHEALDKLYTQGYRATKVIIATRYQELMSGYLERSSPWRSGQSEITSGRLYGLPVDFSPDPQEEPRWNVINFDLEKEPGVPVRYPYFKLFD